MRLRNVKNALEIVNNSKYTITDLYSHKGKFNEVFQNDNPICLEIGMGKGDFIIDMARKNPDINFVGLEKYESVLCRAVLKMDELELPNLRVIAGDALALNDIFDQEIDTIYLNFSDPWPKKRHAKRRLTSPVFLKIYDSIFKGKATIKQKTDNIDLFAYSVCSLSQYGYTIMDMSLDLANTPLENSETEYEKKFKKQGLRINYLEAIKNNDPLDFML